MNYLGRFLFWITWPLIWVYAPLRLRARVLVQCGDEYLLVKPYFGSGNWQLPGGGVAAHEDPKIAAKREVYEETGIDLAGNELTLLEPHFMVYEKGLRMRYILYATSVQTKPKTVAQPREIAIIAWLKKSELVRTDKHVLHALSLVQKSK